MKTKNKTKIIIKIISFSKTLILKQLLTLRKPKLQNYTTRKCFINN